MKVTIQNGAKHGLTRAEVESIVHVLPKTLVKNVKSLVLYQVTTQEIKIQFYPKEQVIGLFWSISYNPLLAKLDAIEELLIALSIINERGELPEIISKNLRAKHKETQLALFAQCKEALVNNVT